MNYVYLLSRLRERLPSPRYILSTALPAAQWALCNINLSAAQNFLDLINIMGYDFAGPWSETSGHHAQLTSPSNPHSDAATASCNSAISYIQSQGVNLKKLLLGIPLYGRSFKGASGIGQRYTGHGGGENVFEYKDLPRPGSQEYVDDQVGAAFCVGSEDGFVSYDAPRTVQLKADYATRNGLGGLFYWAITGDARGARSLVEVGYNTLHDL